MLLKKGLGFHSKLITEDEACGDCERRWKSFGGETGIWGNLGCFGDGDEERSSFLAPDRHHGDRDLRESEVKAGENGIACLLDDGLWAD